MPPYSGSPNLSHQFALVVAVVVVTCEEVTDLVVDCAEVLVEVTDLVVACVEVEVLVVLLVLVELHAVKRLITSNVITRVKAISFLAKYLSSLIMLLF